MLGKKRSATPSGSANPPVGAGKKASSISLSGLVNKNPPSNENSKYKKHFSTSALPENKKMFLENNVYQPSKQPVVESGTDWLSVVQETLFICHDESNCLLHFELDGGADEGEFPHVGQPIVEDPADVGLHVSGDPIEFGSVLLEIQGQKVSGYTAADVARWFKHCLQSKNPVVVRSVPKGRAAAILIPGRLFQR